VKRIVALTSGAEARLTNEGAPLAAVLVNGGTARAVPGTWSATSELLATRLAPRFPGLTFVEVRYRVKTWNELPSCMADAESALDLVAAAGASSAVLVGFSMGGAVSVGVAGHDAVGAVVGLAPWIPERLPVDGLRGKRFDVVHGAWDRWLPGIPGVSPTISRRGFDRARALGVVGTYRLIPRGLHGAAVRRPSGELQPLPRWRAWVEHTAALLDRFVAEPASA
jgi:pimeloyl-ACP methyl ester carboxylesterase